MTDPFFKGSTGRSTRGVLRITILCVIAAAAVASRLFSVIRTCTLKKPQVWIENSELFVNALSLNFWGLQSKFALEARVPLIIVAFRFRKYYPRMSVSFL